MDEGVSNETPARLWGHIIVTIVWDVRLWHNEEPKVCQRVSSPCHPQTPRTAMSLVSSHSPIPKVHMLQNAGYGATSPEAPSGV